MLENVIKRSPYLHSRLEIILLNELIPKTKKIRPQQYNVSTFNTKHSSGEVVAKQRRLLPNYVMILKYKIVYEQVEISMIL